ncbi:MAG: hypothetical protein K2K02_08410 [Ruminococcus sp.]|nr:hypothetical protein [Ruminococcus sp.]MDE6679048.1 hypothetical protein [Ruminococcus sp.]
MNEKKNKNYSRKVFGTAFAVLCALFVAIFSIMYIIYKSLSVKSDWTDYDECGI